MDIEPNIQYVSEYAESVHRQIIRWSLLKTSAHLSIYVVAAFIVIKYVPQFVNALPNNWQMWVVGAISVMALKPIVQMMKLVVAPKLFVVEYLTRLDVNKVRQSYGT